MTEPGPITWALDLLAAHTIRPLAEDEDPHRLLGELLSLGWDVSWTDAPLPKTERETPYARCLRSVEHVDELNREAYRAHCERLRRTEDADQYEVTGKAPWLPVGEVRFRVTGRDLGEAATFALALALDLQGNR